MGDVNDSEKFGVKLYSLPVGRPFHSSVSFYSIQNFIEITVNTIHDTTQTTIHDALMHHMQCCLICMYN